MLKDFDVEIAKEQQNTNFGADECKDAFLFDHWICANCDFKNSSSKRMFPTRASDNTERISVDFAV